MKKKTVHALNSMLTMLYWSMVGRSMDEPSEKKSRDIRAHSTAFINLICMFVVIVTTLAGALKIIIAFILAAAYRVHLHSHSGSRPVWVVVVVVIVDVVVLGQNFACHSAKSSNYATQ